MSKIIGQAKLMSVIDSYYARQNLPKTLMFIGPPGCGKHTVAKYIAERFELAYEEINENVSSEDLDDYLHKTLDTMYLIDLAKFSEKQQNQFLKFIEEPSKSVNIVLTANSEAGVLDTVLNRSTKHYFELYTKEQIEEITNTSINDKAFNIFKTPGKLINLTESSFNSVLDLANKVVYELTRLSYANALALSTKINYKDLYNKVDFNLFFDAVEYLALEDFKYHDDIKSLIVFTITNKFKQYSMQSNLIKETLMLNYLTTLWEALQNDINGAERGYFK